MSTLCESRRAPAPQVGRAKRALRATRTALHILRGVAIAAFGFPFYDRARRMRAVRDWSRQLLRIFDVRLTVGGAQCPPVPALLVANHVSWLDILVLNAVTPSRFVSKADVRRWPLIGWLAARAGTVFLQRGQRRDAGRVSRSLAQALEEGERCAVFPEGKTSAGDVVLPFHASLLQPAVQAGTAVYPVALRYLDPSGALCRDVAYYGGKTTVDTLRALWRLRYVRVEVVFCEPLSSSGSDRRTLARAAEHAIRETLSRAAPHN